MCSYGFASRAMRLHSIRVRGSLRTAAGQRAADADERRFVQTRRLRARIRRDSSFIVVLPSCGGSAREGPIDGGVV